MKTSENPAPANTGGAAPARGWVRAVTGPAAACAVLALFWAVMVASLRDKSLTYDEVAYAAAGYSQWHFGDYRLQPENGLVPERVAGLPMALSLAPLPAPDPAAWRDAEQWQVGHQWLYRSGRDAAGLGTEGRMCCGLFAVALGALVWAWSRRLFGPLGGMLSLLLFVLNPTVLANGALMTSDMAAALFLAASAWAIWAALERLTLGRLMLGAALLGALFLTKLSALLILPLALLLAGARLADRRPLAVSLPGFRRQLASRPKRSLAIGAAALAQALAVVAIVWAGYGFRYSAFAEPGAEAGRFRFPWEYLLGGPGPQSMLRSLDLSGAQWERAQAILTADGAAGDVWTNRALDAEDAIRRDVLTPEQARRLDGALSRPSGSLWVRAVGAARRHRLLPEAWLYGFTDVWRRSQVRPAFLNGEFRLRGWHSFFPYTFLVKTPLAVFAAMALALAAADWRGRRARAGGGVLPGATLPLWVLLLVYWAAAISSHLNIGHRHLTPVYAPLFILCGIAARWLGERGLAPAEAAVRPARCLPRAAAAALGALIVLLAVEDARFFPNYLAYFNGIVRPGNAYRHLVDSSLDWGQDLPAVRSYVDGHAGSGGPFYLSYFGTASPDYYGIRAFPLFSVAGLDGRLRPDWKNVFMAPGDVEAALPAIREEWPDHDLLGMQRLGGSVAATLLRKPERLALGAGTYLVSASMLQPVNFALSGPWGHWNRRYEAEYQELYAAVRPLMSAERADRIAALVRRNSGDWPQLLERFEEYRFGRLAAYLRQREPDDEINYTVMVYRLSASDVARALDGPPPEIGPDDGERERLGLPAVGAQ